MADITIKALWFVYWPTYLVSSSQQNTVTFLHNNSLYIQSNLSHVSF